LTDAPGVDALADLLGQLALEQLRNAAGELDHVDAPRQLPARVGEDLPVLGGDQPAEHVRPGLRELAEAEQDPGANHWRRARPRREGRGRGAHRSVHLGRGCERDLAAPRTGGRIEHVPQAVALARGGAAADPV